MIIFAFGIAEIKFLFCPDQYTLLKYFQMFKWFFRFFRKSDKKVLDLSDVDVIITPKLKIDLTDHIDEILINKDESMNTIFNTHNGLFKIKEIDVETIKINGIDVTDDILEMALKNKELY